MSRYARMFDRLAGEGAFGAFVMLGDPGLAESAAILDVLVEGGADMIEVGIPFSDPVADGPVIQAAGTRALVAGVTPVDCFDLIAGFRTRHPGVPVGILTYANLVVARGRDAFYARAAEAGTDSVLVADVPLLEAEPFAASARLPSSCWAPPPSPVPLSPGITAATTTPAPWAAAPVTPRTRTSSRSTRSRVTP